MDESELNNNKKCNGMNEVRVAILDEIGFEWVGAVYDGAWEEKYKELIDFNKATHGHCNVPQRDPANKALGSWVNRQRWC